MYIYVLLCTRFLYVVPVLKYQTALSFFLRQLYHFRAFQLGAGGAGGVRCTCIHSYKELFLASAVPRDYEYISDCTWPLIVCVYTRRFNVKCILYFMQLYVVY